MQVQSWMLDENLWAQVPKPYDSWNILSYYVIAVNSSKEVSQAQEDYFDYVFAAMLQQDVGWY